MSHHMHKHHRGTLDHDAQREIQIAAAKSPGIPWAAIIRTTLILVLVIAPFWH